MPLSDRARSVVDAEFVSAPVVEVENLRPVPTESSGETPREVGPSGIAAPPPAAPGDPSPRGVYGRSAHAVADVVEVVADGVDGAGRTLRFAGRQDLGQTAGRAAETARVAAGIVRTVGEAADVVATTGGRLKEAWGKLKKAAKMSRAAPRTSVRAERAAKNR